MVGKHVTVVALALSLLLPATSPFAVTSFAQMSASCNREMARQDAALRQFDADAQREGMTFARNEVREAGLDVLKDRLAGNATAEALEQARQAWKQWQDFLEQGKSYMELFHEFAQCAKLGASGCMNDLIAKNTESKRLLGRASDASNEWIKSLGNDTISKAVDRVEKARSIMENLATRAGNLALGAASGAIENCFRDMEQRVEARRNADARSSPPQPRLPQPPASQPPVVQPAAPENTGGNSGAGSGGGGGHAAAIVGGSAAAAGAGVGLYVLNEAQKKAQCDQYETEMDSRGNAVVNASNSLVACGSNTSCINTRLNTLNSALSSMLTTAGNWCTCLGPDAASELSAADKAELRDALNAGRALGINPGTLPACFR